MIELILIKLAVAGIKGAAFHGASTTAAHGVGTAVAHSAAQQGATHILGMESVRNAAAQAIIPGSQHLAVNAGIMAHAAGSHAHAALTTRHLYEAVALGGGSYAANWAVEKIIKKIKARAEEISRGPGSRGELDNWLAAEREVLTRERAAEIARYSSGTPEDHWGIAEFEVITSQRARGIANSDKSRRSDLDNWLAGEEEARILLRAEAISKRNPKAGDLDNWLAAKRELGLA